MNICKSCKSEFKIEESFIKLLDKISPVIDNDKYSLPLPTLCPDCRQRRRLSYRNEKMFYKRKCDFTGLDIISVYSSDKECKVYNQETWWSDDWNPLDYGRDFDFSRPFFDQYYELSIEVPRPALVNMSSENSLYTNHSVYNKNSYMCVNTGYSEDCMYITNYNLNNKDCVDCLAIQNCERCYFCVDTKKSSYSYFLDECKNCVDSYFCFDCHNVKYCFGCYNLRNKEYHIYNKPYSKDEYIEKLEELRPKTWAEVMNIYSSYLDFILMHAIHRNIMSININNCSGDHIFNSKNVSNSFYISDSEDCAYCYDAAELKDCTDATEPYKGELTHETHACNIDYNCVSLSKCYESDNAYYSQYAWNSKNIFGCFGLNRQEFCIFNKKYSEDQYNHLVSKIISHMIETKEWGEFFPISKSGFCYNETVANEYYPLDKESSLRNGYSWYNKTQDLPEQRHSAYNCIKCGKPYIFTKQEILFYDQVKIPKPEFCFDCRHDMRFKMRPTRTLHNRNCTKCNIDLVSTYSNNEAKIVYCENCYLAEVQ